MHHFRLLIYFWSYTWSLKCGQLQDWKIQVVCMEDSIYPTDQSFLFILYSRSTTTLHFFLQKAIPYARISFRPSFLNRSSYLRSLICRIAFSQALESPWNVWAYFSSIMIPASGSSVSIRMSTSPSPDSMFDWISHSDSHRNNPKTIPW